MKLGILGLVLIALTIIFCTNGVAQEYRLGSFNGRGIRSSKYTAPEVKESKWPKLLDFTKSKPETTDKKPFSGWFSKKPSFDFLKRENRPKPFSGLAEMFPKRDPDRPNFFTQLNAKSKAFIDRTTGWAHRKNDGIRDPSNDTWDALTKDLEQIREDQSHSEPAQPTQPPIRTAGSSGQPNVRF